ncbi:hypothetical protein [Thermospira aquatica]|uniref:Uncharacterized protein n=1 Tax=Thermospira aquatica TaxID=2828656 RepID=A0AAX3BBB6_9SPIR|nr:hypothetical protein [Thermospira aquatica]URA09515.1 hypothetical protein KDW03_08450 [Thermospira aquatica]
MQLSINGEIVDVTLEGEKTAWDLVMSLTRILAEEDRIITGVTINNTFYSSDNDVLEQIPVEEIQDISLEVAEKREVVKTLLQKSQEICISVAQDLQGNGYAHVAQYKEIMEWILEVLEIVHALSPVEMVESSLIRNTILELIKYWQSDNKDEKDIPQLVQVMQSLSQYFELLMSKVVLPVQIEREELEKALDELLEMLPQISESFQLGHDRIAFEKIYQVVAILESAILYLRQHAADFAGRDDEIENMAQGMNALLSDIVAAIEKSDLVYLGDLMEYELPEKIELYRSVVWSSDGD